MAGKKRYLNFEKWECVTCATGTMTRQQMVIHVQEKHHFNITGRPVATRLVSTTEGKSWTEKAYVVNARNVVLHEFIRTEKDKNPFATN